MSTVSMNLAVSLLLMFLNFSYWPPLLSAQIGDPASFSINNVNPTSYHPASPGPYNVSDNPALPVSGNKGHTKLGLGFGIAALAFFCIFVSAFAHVSVKRWSPTELSYKELKAALFREELSLEGRVKNVNSLFMFQHEQVRPSPVPDLNGHPSLDFQGRQFFAEESQGFLHHDENSENLSCTNGKTIWKSNFQLEDNGFFSHSSAASPYNQYLPVFEAFVMHEENGNLHIAGDEISFDKLDLPMTKMECASVLEQLCLSASMHTPLPQFSTDKLNRTPNLCPSLPNGLLECKDDAGKQLRTNYSCMHEEINHTFQGSSNFDPLPFSTAHFAWNISKPYTSPVLKLQGCSTSSSGNSDKQLSLNPELTCFPIEEDPRISEENERQDDVLHEGISSDRGCLDSVNRDINVCWTQSQGKEKLQNLRESKTRCINETKENHSLSEGKNSVKGATRSLHNRFSKQKLPGKANLRKRGPSFSERKSKLNKIIPNITSFVPLVQQIQMAAVVTGKRDVKVKALEAAEAARRLEEKRENECKMKKEALKLEHARLEQEKLKQLELKKKKKVEERKKKEAEMAARKRQKEEEKRKEKEAKRKRTEEAWRQQREIRAEKRKEKRREATKGAKDEVKINKKMEEGNLAPKPELELRTISIVLKDSVALGDDGDIRKVTGNLDKAAENNLFAKTCQEWSSEISPHQSPDDDIAPKKFIPSCKNYLAIAESSHKPKSVSAEKLFTTLKNAIEEQIKLRYQKELLICQVLWLELELEANVDRQYF